MWLGFAVVASYVASPYLAAFLLHSAIKQGNAGYIQPRVDWDAVRLSLKQSITFRMAEQATTRAPNGIFQAIKFEVVDTVAPYVLDYMLDSKVTAEGFIDYLKPKVTVQTAPTAAPASLAGLPARGRWFLPPALRVAPVASAWPNTDMLKRIDRAQFISLTEFEIDVRDKNDPKRRYRATFELMHYQWQLARVDVLSLGDKAL